MASGGFALPLDLQLIHKAAISRDGTWSLAHPGSACPESHPYQAAGKYRDKCMGLGSWTTFKGLGLHFLCFKAIIKAQCKSQSCVRLSSSLQPHTTTFFSHYFSFFALTSFYYFFTNILFLNIVLSALEVVAYLTFTVLFPDLCNSVHNWVLKELIRPWGSVLSGLMALIFSLCVLVCPAEGWHKASPEARSTLLDLPAPKPLAKWILLYKWSYLWYSVTAVEHRLIHRTFLGHTYLYYIFFEHEDIESL